MSFTWWRLRSKKYALALLFVGLVLALKCLVTWPLGRDAPFLLVLGAVALAATYGGWGPALVSTALGTGAVSYFFLPPYHSWQSTPAATAQTVVFAGECLLVASLSAMLQAARQRAETSQQHVARRYATSSALARARTLEDVSAVIACDGAASLAATSAAVYVAEVCAGSFRCVAAVGDDPPALESAQSGVGPAPTKALRLPMTVHDSQVGVLVMGFARPRRLIPEEVAVARAVAQEGALSMERARLFEAERRARIELQQASRAKDEFLGVVSHELRSPLTAIMGWVQLMKRGGVSDPARLERGLEVIERNASAQARLVEDILDVSRVVAGKLKMEKQTVELAALVRACVDEMRPTALARAIAIETRTASEAEVVGDADRLRQVMRNLLSNAIKFTPSGGHVWVDVEAGAEDAVVRVRDDGRGIPAAELPRLFEPFHQVDSSLKRREGGLGLGLAIVRSLVEAHAGAVDIDSPGPGRGATARVRLPLSRSTSGERADDASKESRGRAADLTGLRVLVVEDDLDSGDVVAETLEGCGAEVRRALSASGALEVLRDFVPDVLISDIGMPDEDGYSLLRKVRALGTPAANVPALALTAYARAEDICAAKAAGYQVHLAKPATHVALAHAVADLALRRA